MKVSDIMLDLATGDASVHDAYIQEAMGQVKVSAAIYNAAKQIALLDDSERSQIVQEAADAGLPYDRDNSIRLMYESVARELIGTSRHLYMEMSKLEEMGSKPTSPFGALNVLGKASGVKTQMDGSAEYVAEFANSVANKGKVNIKENEGKYLKAKPAKKLTSNLIQGVAILCNAFCIDTKALFADETIKALVPAPMSTKPDKDEDGKDNCSIGYMVSAIKSGAKFVKECEISESDFSTGEIRKDDIATVMSCYTAITKVGKFIKSKFGENGSKIEAMINKATNKKSKKNISGDIEDANEKGDSGKALIVEFNENLFKLCSNLTQALNDSHYTLMNVKNKE